ncbi:hypothetical protein KUW11_21355 [Maritimibacter alkaliphilus]|nr:hypothetical protein [Maritimibacter alkaliphilus]
MGQRGATYTVTAADEGADITVTVYYTDGYGTVERVTSAALAADAGNHAPTGAPEVSGTPRPGETLTMSTDGIADADGLGTFYYEWWRDGVRIPGAFSQSYEVQAEDLGHAITARVAYTDGYGTAERVASAPVSVTATGGTGLTLTGDAGNNRLEGGAGADSLSGLGGNDTLIGAGASDTLRGGDGSDVLNGGDGDDILIGGETVADLRDVIYGGTGNDSVDGGYGNDELRGDAGNDTLEGNYGADTVIGGDGDDLLTGGTWGDALFGGDGADFLNGGFGHDQVNGGAGADRFYHLGVEGHGSDWIQDYDAAEGDVLQFGGTASAADFQVNFTETANAGTAGVEEAFVIYRPTGQILWALVDGGAQDSINLVLNGTTHDLLSA